MPDFAGVQPAVSAWSCFPEHPALINPSKPKRAIAQTNGVFIIKVLFLSENSVSSLKGNAAGGDAVRCLQPEIESAILARLLSSVPEVFAGD
ncbi:MAG: hypothetical protein ACRYFS_21060 [Janthinobacterium lividum]